MVKAQGLGSQGPNTPLRLFNRGNFLAWRLFLGRTSVLLPVASHYQHKPLTGALACVLLVVMLVLSVDDVDDVDDVGDAGLRASIEVGAQIRVELIFRVEPSVTR